MDTRKGLVQWLLLQLFHFVIAQSSICPAPEAILPCICTSRHDDFQIWCTHSDLPQVLKGVQKIGEFIRRPIDELIIENNYLPSLPGKVFQNVRITRLMLRHNGLERLSAAWLETQEMNLVEIYIVENDLKSLPSESLSKLQNIQAITIQSQSLKRIPTLSGLRKLRYINIHSESLSAINENTFENLPNIEKIFIQGSPNLRIVKENAFYNLPQLRKLAITNCGINAIHMRALSLLPALKELSLSNNKIIDASMVGRAIRDLSTLSHLNLNYNQLDKLNEGAFVDQTMLEHLFLSNNNISIIHHGAFHRVPKLRTVDLNYNRISQIHPESFLQHSSSGVEELTLIGNRIMYISEFRALLDALPRLKFLDLSDNLLQEIPRGALRGHPSLERLHLTKNSIKYIQADAFVAMPALRELHLSNNSLSDLNEGPYWNLPALKGLDLSFNYFNRLQPKLLYNLPSLRRINFSHNQLNVIDPITFLESPLLEHVNVSGNVLVSIHPATFRNLAKLYELDASSNRLVEFVPGLPRGLEQLYLNQNQITNLPMPPSPDLDLPSLRTLDISSNGVQKIPFGSLQTLHNLRRFYMKRNGLRQVEITTFNDLHRLEILDISYNQILTIHPKSFNKLSSLKEINLHGNTIENFDFIAIQDNAALSSLDFSKNKLKSINPSSVNKALEVEILNISTNNLYELPRILNMMSKLRVLDASFNNIKYFDGNSINSINTLKEFKMPSNKILELKTGSFKDLRDLETIDLDNNDIEIIHPKAIMNLPNLISIYLTRNHIIDLPDRAFSNLPKLKVLEIQGNRLQYVSSRAFDNLLSLQYLNLSNNHIANIDDSGLRQLSSLEVLDLSFNKLKRLTRASFQYMEWLVELNLDNNLICHINGQPFDFMSRLKVLSLRNNRLSTLSEKSFAKLRNNIAILDFDGNPLICNCHIIWLKSWLAESTSVGPKCADGTYVKGMPFGRYDCPSTGEINEDDMRLCMTHENEALLPNLATSQVFSTLNKIKDYTSQIKNNYQANKFNRPSPEESDYFYDDYVDYPYNETLINSLNNEVSSTQNHNSTLGGVPTIYAAMNNSTNKFRPTQATKSPNGGFTFFGMPLPPIDMGKLINTGRKMDWPENKRTHTHSSSTHNSNNHNKYQLPEAPKFETGGFSPILPNTLGGFKPILDPRVNMSNIQVQTQGDKNYSNEASLKHTVAVVSTKPPIKTVQSNTSHLKSKSEIHELEAFLDDDNGTHLAYNRTKNIEEQKVEPNNMSKYNLMESNLTVTQVTEKEPMVITTDTSNDMSVQAWMESTTSSYSSSTAFTFRPPMKKHMDPPPPTALLAVLAASKTAEALERSQNRPATITKVNLAHIDNFDHNFSPNREPKTRFTDMSTSNTKTREVDDNDWYYKNYNNSNLEPYIAPGIHKDTSNANSINHNIFLVIIITYCII